MRKLLAALAVLAMPLAGCATVAAVSGQEEIAKYDERALLTAEVSFNTALEAISQATTIGAVTPAQAKALVPKVENAKKALDRARTLYDANRSAEGETGGAVLAVAALLQNLIELGVIKS
jgi:hypothetical protein